LSVGLKGITGATLIGLIMSRIHADWKVMLLIRALLVDVEDPLMLVVI
jgi:hypothetical protein